jgi:hypothetical protein
LPCKVILPALSMPTYMRLTAYATGSILDHGLGGRSKR